MTYHEERPEQFLLRLLLSSMLSAGNQDEELLNFEAYFMLLTALIKYKIESENGGDKGDDEKEEEEEFRHLYGNLVDQLLTHESIEEENAERVDRIMVGLFKILAVLCHHISGIADNGVISSEDLIRTIFETQLLSRSPRSQRKLNKYWFLFSFD